MKKHKLAIILLPITIWIWLIGWSLFWTGSKRKQIKPVQARAKANKDKIEMIAALSDEQLATADD